MAHDETLGPLQQEVMRLMREAAQATDLGMAGWVGGREGVTAEVVLPDGELDPNKILELVLAFHEGQRQAILRLAAELEALQGAD
jgi:hypothetical protein